MTYAEAANLAVNQTLVRSINTSIVALLPVGAILYVGAVQLGSGSLKDLALALFVGMAAGAYSSIFIATPLLVHLKSRGRTSSAGREARRRPPRGRRARRSLRRPDRRGDEPARSAPATTTPPDAGRRWPATSARRRPAGAATPPRPHSAVARSGASGRVQPTRQPRSQSGKR